MGYGSETRRRIAKAPKRSNFWDIHQTVLEKYQEHKERRINATIPPPPFAGTSSIVPITTESELFLEGLEQDNCVYDYIEEIENHGMAIYKVLFPQRATLSVKLNQQKIYELDQIKKASNHSVNQQTVRLVKQWFTRVSESGKNWSGRFSAEYIRKRNDEVMSSYHEYCNLKKLGALDNLRILSADKEMYHERILHDYLEALAPNTECLSRS